MVNPTVTLVYKYSLFPSVRPVCDLLDDFFCIQRRQEQSGKAEEEKYAHQRRGRFLRMSLIHISLRMYRIPHTGTSSKGQGLGGECREATLPIRLR